MLALAGKVDRLYAVVTCMKRTIKTQIQTEMKKTLTKERNTENFLKVRRLRNDSVFISGPVELFSRRKRIQRTSDNRQK